ncbi:hypothetical protein C900_02056 [Fulvivirga imtechensis AK7]|uniref:Uncharacterized protein n=1 Tax=Fulvivirga imtechensis AK7 TaxID=1237149 RepID=L8K2H3_9BACT|nr:hypothetical protein C900_02056 [Fulvivirga imtechensis AK7]
MLKNYFTIAYRTLVKNNIYSLMIFWGGFWDSNVLKSSFGY